MIDKKMAAASAFVIAVGVATGAGMYFIHNGSNATTTEQTEVINKARLVMLLLTKTVQSCQNWSFLISNPLFKSFLFTFLVFYFFINSLEFI